MQTDHGFPNILWDRFLSLLLSNKETETPLSEVNIEPQNLRAERDFPNHRIQSPHFTGEKTPKRLNGTPKVTRLLNGVDGTWTQAFRPLVKCSFHYSATFAKKSAAKVKLVIWTLRTLSAHHWDFLSTYCVPLRDLNSPLHLSLCRLCFRDSRVKLQFCFNKNPSVIRTTLLSNIA